MRIDRMETGESFLGDFLGCHTQGDVLQYLRFRLGQVDFLLHILRWSQKHLGHTLTDVTIAMDAELHRFLDLRHRTLLEQNAKLHTAGDEHSHEVGTQVLTEEQPSGMRESLLENEEFIGIIDVEGSVVEYHHGIVIILQGKHQLSLVLGIFPFHSLNALQDVNHAGTGNILSVC